MIDTLQQDLERITKEELPVLVDLASGPDPASACAAIAGHLTNTLYPILIQIAEEIGEIDDAVEDLGAEADNILQPETAEVFGMVILKAAVIVAELKKRLTMKEDAKIIKLCKEFEDELKEAEQVLKEIYVPQADPEDKSEEEDEDKSKESGA